jgi:hypothetical protein
LDCGWESLAGLKHIQAQIDGVFSHDSLSDAAEPFHVLHMDSMSDDSMSNQLQVTPHTMFWTVDGKSLAGLKQIQSQTVQPPP